MRWLRVTRRPLSISPPVRAQVQPHNRLLVKKNHWPCPIGRPRRSDSSAKRQQHGNESESSWVAGSISTHTARITHERRTGGGRDYPLESRHPDGHAAILSENQHYVVPKRDLSEGTDDGTFQQIGVLSRTAESKKQRQEATPGHKKRWRKEGGNMTKKEEQSVKPHTLDWCNQNKQANARKGRGR